MLSNSFFTDAVKFFLHRCCHNNITSLVCSLFTPIKLVPMSAVTIYSVRCQINQFRFISISISSVQFHWYVHFVDFQLPLPPCHVVTIKMFQTSFNTTIKILSNRMQWYGCIYIYNLSFYSFKILGTNKQLFNLSSFKIFCSLIISRLNRPHVCK